MKNDHEERLIDEPEEHPVTLDDLAGMVQRGFADMSQRLTRIENILISKQDERITKLEKKMERIEELLPS